MVYDVVLYLLYLFYLREFMVSFFHNLSNSPFLGTYVDKDSRPWGSITTNSFDTTVYIPDDRVYIRQSSCSICPDQKNTSA